MSMGRVFIGATANANATASCQCAEDVYFLLQLRARLAWFSCVWLCGLIDIV